MLDFTSTLYLGLRHATGSVRPWSQLTTGAPAALLRPAGEAAIADQLAGLQGCQQATLGPSTLHLFWDLFGMLARERIAVFLDAGAYPIAGWGVERAAAQGVPVRCFPHRDAEALRRILRQSAGARWPVVVADGMCTTCGCTTPIAAYLTQVRDVGGLLVIDDTQALGVLGDRPDAIRPYGYGGGGSLRHTNTGGQDVLVISSLAKGFGVPMAVLSGSRAIVRRFEMRSETGMHCSPPSYADIHAAEHALKLNKKHGDTLRTRLARRVRQFRRLLAAAGFRVDGGLFPVQTLRLPSKLDAGRVQQGLLGRGVRTVLRRGCARDEPALTFIITAQHRPAELEQAVRALASATSRQLHLRSTDD